MRTALVVVAVAAIVLVAAVSWSRRKDRSPDTRSLIVSLPNGWSEIPGQTPREYRRDAEGSGVLQISILPPPERRITRGNDAEKELTRTLDGLGMDLGQRLALSNGRAASGIMATALHRNDRQGLMQFWLIFGETTIFASYTMGRPETAKQELAEAAEIVKLAAFK